MIVAFGNRMKQRCVHFFISDHILIWSEVKPAIPLSGVPAAVLVVDISVNTSKNLVEHLRQSGGIHFPERQVVYKLKALRIGHLAERFAIQSQLGKGGAVLKAAQQQENGSLRSGQFHFDGAGSIQNSKLSFD